MNIHRSKTVLLIAAVLSCTPFGNAQVKIKEESAPPPQSMIGLPGASRFGTDPLHLLQTAKVKQELKITDEQSARIAKVGDKYDREAASKLGNVQKGGLNARQIRETEDKLIESSRQEVSTILNPDQLNRLKQILLQVNGAEALQDKEVAKQVGITPEESAKIQKLQLQTNAMLRDSLGAPRSGEPAQTQMMLGANVKTADKINNQAQEQYLGALTPEQKQKLEKLQGAPFTLDRNDVVGH